MTRTARYADSARLFACLAWWYRGARSRHVEYILRAQAEVAHAQGILHGMELWGVEEWRRLECLSNAIARLALKVARS